jgi:hypothetical protein
MKHLRRLYILAVLAVSACNPYDCVYESRFVGANGSADVTNGSLIVEYVNTRQYRDDGPLPSEVIWHIRAERLVSPATTMTLRNAQGQVMLTLTMTSTSATSMTAAGSSQITSADRDKFFDLLAGGNATVVLA